MRIISQDKMSDVEYNGNDIDVLIRDGELQNVYEYQQSITFIKGFHIVKNNIKLLGTYSSKEKVLKVMEMICQPRYWVPSNALINEGDFVPGIERYVFYMPKDEEVK